MDSSNRYKATATLVVVSAGFLIAYPLKDAFFLAGMIASACGAAVVGGLADWFAVTALFRRPLGIPFRTAVIPRNRDKLLKEISNMVENELLTPKNITRELVHYDISELILEYLEKHGGLADVKAVAHRISLDVIKRVQPDEIGRLADSMAKETMAKMRLAPIIAEAIEWSVKNGYEDRVIKFILDEVARLLQQPQAVGLISKIISEAIQVYERDMTSRQLVNAVLEISPDKLAGLAQAQLTAFIGEVRSTEHPLRAKIRGWIQQLIETLKADQGFQADIEKWKIDRVNKIDLQPYVTEMVTNLRNTTTNKEGSAKLMAWVNSKVDSVAERFKQDQDWQKQVDTTIKVWLGRWVAQNHDKIGSLVKEKLDEFTDKNLVGFIEDKVGNDLQMIRINGSVVGGLVGMMIFLLRSLMLP